MKIYTTTRKAARRWLLRTLQPCQAMVPVMSESLERRLGLVERTKLRLHLLVCAWCARYFTQIKVMRRILGGVDSHLTNNVAPTLAHEARERIAKALQISRDST